MIFEEDQRSLTLLFLPCCVASFVGMTHAVKRCLVSPESSLPAVPPLIPVDKPQLQEEKSRRNGDTHHISELQQRLADCTSLDFDLSNSIRQCERSTYIQSAKKYWRISLSLSPTVGSRLVV
ncbi:hypothetical protein T08_12814 [Trichinella sp. T8]|nr:hypothetical protein T08_12814 [Trichinella sp. T8]